MRLSKPKLGKEFLAGAYVVRLFSPPNKFFGEIEWHCSGVGEQCVSYLDAFGLRLIGKIYDGGTGREGRSCDL